MLYALHFLRRRFGRADIEAFINEHAVAGDNLGVQFFGKVDTQLSFSYGGRA